MRVVQVIVVDFFNVLRLGIDNNKAWGGTEVFIYPAFQSLQCFSRETNLHVTSPLSLNRIKTDLPLQPYGICLNALMGAVMNT
jgi:hypothetical protein